MQDHVGFIFPFCLPRVSHRECRTNVSFKSVSQECLPRSVPQECRCKSVSQKRRSKVLCLAAPGVCSRSVVEECLTRVSSRSVFQECRSKSVFQDLPRVSSRSVFSRNVFQGCLTEVSSKSFFQECPARVVFGKSSHLVTNCGTQLDNLLILSLYNHGEIQNLSRKYWSRNGSTDHSVMVSDPSSIV